MGLNIGPGLAAWIQSNGATPLGDECYLSPGFQISAVPIEIGNDKGQKVRTLVGYDKASGLIIPPGPGVLVGEVKAPPAPPSDFLTELANQQGTYDGGVQSSTCGERAAVMAAVKDGLLAADAGADKALTDELWTYVQGPGVPETQWGTTVGQERYVLQYIADKYGKTLRCEPVNTVDDIRDGSFAHKVLALEGVPLPGMHHWLLDSSDQGGFVHVLDSAHNLDMGADVYSESQVMAGSRWLGGQFGWKFSFE